jgi:hypothetical protein
MQGYDYNPQNMQAVGNLPLMFTNRGLEWLDQAQSRDQGTLAEVMAQREHAAKTRPLDLQQKEATLASTQASTNAQNISNEWAPKLNEATLDAKLFKLTQDKSDDEIKDIVRQATKLMTSNDPEARKIGSAVYERLPAVMEQRRAEEAAEAAAQRKDATQRYGIDTTAATAANRLAHDQAVFDHNKGNPPQGSDLSLDKLAAQQLIRMHELMIQRRPEAAADPNYYIWLAEQAALLKQNSAPAANNMVANPAVVRAGGQPVQVPRSSVTPIPRANTAPGFEDIGSLPQPRPTSQPTTPEEAKQAGWRLMKDKNNNQAYVGPNNEIMVVK